MRMLRRLRRYDKLGTRRDSRRFAAQPVVLTTMSSGEGDDSEYDDIKVFFTSSEWKELTSEEKRCHRKSKDNYEAIRRCGWTTRPPFFMCRKPLAPARQHQPEQQDETAGEGAALPSKVLPSLLDQAEEQGHPPAPSPDQPREGASVEPRTLETSIFDPKTSRLSTPQLSTLVLTTSELTTPEPKTSADRTPGLSTPEPPKTSEPRTSAVARLPKRAVSRKAHKDPVLQVDHSIGTAPEARTSRRKTHEPRTPEARTSKRKTHEPRTDEPRTSRRKTHEPRTSEPRTSRRKTHEPRTPEARTSRRKTHEPRISEAPRSPKHFVSRKTHQKRPSQKQEPQDNVSLTAPKSPPAGAAGAPGHQARDGGDHGQLDAAREAPHRCATCGAAFRRAALLRAHMLTHAADELDSGEHCGVRSPDSADLRRHTWTRTGAAAGARTSRLKAHRPRTPATSRFPKRATNSNTLKEAEPQDDAHLSDSEPPAGARGAAGARGHQPQGGEDHVHQDAAREAPHRCATCGAAFRRAALLRAHLRTHAADKQDGGEPCGDTSAASADLRGQARTHTGASPQPRTSEPSRTTEAMLSAGRTPAAPRAPNRAAGRETHKEPELQEQDDAIRPAAQPPPTGVRGERAQDGEDHGLQGDAGDVPHRCATCGAAFRRAALLRAHMRNHAAGKLDGGKHCGVTSAAGTDLRRNVRTRTGDRPYECQTCGKGFSHSTTLRRHMRTHTGERPYQCQTCGKQFTEHSTLRVHMRTHTGEKPYQCQTCGRGFSDSTTFRRHIRTHTGEKPYECHTCGKGFSDSTTFRRHMMIHTGEKPYECQTCGKRFRESTKLRVHIRTHTGEKPYECQTCGKGFITSTSLRLHVRTHTGQKPYVCQTCSHEFAKNTNLRRHMWTHASEKPYICQICDKGFTASTTLRRHMWTHRVEP